MKKSKMTSSLNKLKSKYSSRLSIDINTEESLLFGLRKLTAEYRVYMTAEFASSYKVGAKFFYNNSKSEYNRKFLAKFLLFYLLGFILKALLSQRDVKSVQLYESYILDLKQILLSFIEALCFRYGMVERKSLVSLVVEYFSNGLNYLDYNNLKCVEGLLLELSRSCVFVVLNETYAAEFMLSDICSMVRINAQQQRFVFKEIERNLFSHPVTKNENSFFSSDQVEFDSYTDMISNYFSNTTNSDYGLT